jgi:DNA-binding transcriptional LysR family regulator
MDIGRLKVFLTVVDEGSISKAADTLNYAQSNITARIKQLERDLGKPLLFRNSKGV